MKPTIGRIVLYMLSAEDAAQINRRRTTGLSIAERIKAGAWPLGAQAHIGTQVQAGDVCPMVVTLVTSPDCINGQVLLDGNDCFWAAGIGEGTGPRTWSWPPRV